MTSSLQYDLYDFVCTFHRIKKLVSKEAGTPTQANAISLHQQNDIDSSLTNEQRGKQINHLLYKILNEIEQRIGQLPSSSEPPSADYFDKWTLLVWTLLSIVNRLERDTEESKSFLDYGGKHFQVSLMFTESEDVTCRKIYTHLLSI